MAEWLGSDFMSLPHGNIESGELKVGPADVVVIPELYGHVLEQIVQMPCQKIILCQAYDYILETLKPGFSWPNYGVTKCITTTTAQKEHIKTICPTVETTIVPMVIREKQPHLIPFHLMVVPKFSLIIYAEIIEIPIKCLSQMESYLIMNHLEGGLIL